MLTGWHYSTQASEAARRFEAQAGAGSSGRASFEARDLESVAGRFHTVCCIDVLIHYPPVCSLHAPYLPGVT
jgi:magnesium-protoporphyrin O-methyltransferase